MERNVTRRRSLALLGGGAVGGALLTTQLGNDEPAEGPSPGTDPETGVDPATSDLGEQAGDRTWRYGVQTIRELDLAVDYRDGELESSSYDPERGRIFLASDTGIVGLGTGDEWRFLPNRSSFPAEVPDVTPETEEELTVDPASGQQGLLETLDSVGDVPTTVRIGAGTIDDIDTNIVIPSNTYLRGEGAGETTLKFADGASPRLAGMLRVEGENVVIRSLELDGNRQNVELGAENLGQEYGFYTSGADNVTVQNVYCHDFPGYGIDPHAEGDTPSVGISVTNCISRNNGLDGFTFAGVENGFAGSNVSLNNDRHGLNATDSEGSGMEFVNNISFANGELGVTVQNEFSDASIRTNLIEANGADGIRIGNGGEEAENVDIIDNYIRANGRYGIILRPSNSVSISANRFEQNSRNGEAEAVIVLSGEELPARNAEIVDNEFAGETGTSHAIVEREPNGPTTVSGNVFNDGWETPVVLNHPDSTSQQ